jgi:hypothetical protein
MGLLISVAPAQAVEDPTLPATGTVVIETSVTGRVHLGVPADAFLDIDVAEVASDGVGFYGFLLTDPGTRNGFYVQSIHHPDTIGFGDSMRTEGRKALEDREEPTVINPIPENTCTRCHVPPGSYDLYVIADGQPVSVRLTIEGLEGSTLLDEETLTPVYGHQFDLTGDPYTQPASGSSAPSVFEFDREIPPGIAFVQFATRAETEGIATIEHQVCVRPTNVPSCDDVATRSGHDIVSVRDDHAMISWPVWELEGGTYDLSSSVVVWNPVIGDVSFQGGAAMLVLGY